MIRGYMVVPELIVVESGHIFFGGARCTLEPPSDFAITDCAGRASTLRFNVIGLIGFVVASPRFLILGIPPGPISIHVVEDL